MSDWNRYFVRTSLVQEQIMNLRREFRSTLTTRGWDAEVYYTQFFKWAKAEYDIDFTPLRSSRGKIGFANRRAYMIFMLRWS